MVHLTLAIADFMGILIAAAFWAAASIGGVALLGLAAAGATLWAARRLFGRQGGFGGVGRPPARTPRRARRTRGRDPTRPDRKPS